MFIVEYEKKYANDVSGLLIELQSYLAEIDNEQVQTLTADYRKHYLNYVISSVNANNGKIYLAVEGDMVIGAIAGIIERKDEEDVLCTRCPVRGVITELIVDKNSRGKGVGEMLFSATEQYFAEKGCEFVSVNVFAPNASAISFYKKMGCTNRNIEMIKRIDCSKNHQFTYRPALIQDFEYLWDKNIRENNNKSQWIKWKKQFIDDNQSGKALTFVVCDNNIPVGEGTLLFSSDCKAVKGRKSLADNMATANINALRIQKQYEGKGCVSKLVKEMERYASENGYSYLTIGAEAAEARNLAIYLHWGYSEFVMSEVDGGELVLYYRKKLK